MNGDKRNRIQAEVPLCEYRFQTDFDYTLHVWKMLSLSPQRCDQINHDSATLVVLELAIKEPSYNWVHTRQIVNRRTSSRS